MANYTHDCDECVSLGGYLATSGKAYDLYCHIERREVGLYTEAGPYAYTLLARYSNRPSDYQSAQTPGTEALAEAMSRAIYRKVLQVVPSA
jgi:hypothetical protein